MLSQKTRCLEIQTEVYSKIPVPLWRAEIVDVKRKAREGEVVDTGNLSNKLRLTEPSAIPCHPIFCGSDAADRTITVEVSSQLKTVYGSPDRTNPHRCIIARPESRIEIVARGGGGGKCRRMNQSGRVVTAQFFNGCDTVYHCSQLKIFMDAEIMLPQ